MKIKFEAYRLFVQFLHTMQTHMNHSVIYLHTDNGTDFDRIFTYCRKQGITIELTEPYTPQQNGTAERNDRKLLRRALLLLNAASLTMGS